MAEAALLEEVGWAVARVETEGALEGLGVLEAEVARGLVALVALE